MLSAMMLVAAAALTPTLSPDETQLDAVCGYALEVMGSSRRDDLEVVERWKGRMEIRMNQLKITDRERPMLRSLCDVYNAGANRGIDIFARRMKEADEAQK